MRRSHLAMLFALATAVTLATSSTAVASVSRSVHRLHEAWEGVIAGKGGSTIKGEAEMEEGKAAKTTNISIKFAGDTPGSTRPWHVHVGSCAKGGPVFGDAKAYTPLVADAKGNAQGKAMLQVALPDSGYYYVNVHESATQMGKIVACGDLLRDD